jgi:hypothetical protein
MSGFDYSFGTYYAQRVVGRGQAPVVHVRRIKTTQVGGHRYPDKDALCGVVSGAYVGTPAPSCRKCIARLRQIEQTGVEGKNSAREAVAAAEYLSAIYAAE